MIIDASRESIDSQSSTPACTTPITPVVLIITKVTTDELDAFQTF
jgi:hypothetical protein